LVLLLVSAHFINSEYCYHREMIRALERASRGEASVVPIILRPCQWAEIPVGRFKLGSLVALPNDAKPVSSFSDRDDAWNQIVGSVRSIILAGKHLSTELSRGPPTPKNLRGSSAKPQQIDPRDLLAAREDVDGTSSRTQKQLEEFSSALVQAIEKTAVAFDRDGVVGLSTGLKDLDRVTGGLVDGELTLMTGEPRWAASLLASNIAFNISSRIELGGIGAPRLVAFIALESSSSRIATTLLARVAQVRLHHVETGNFSADEFGKLKTAAEAIQDLPLVISDERDTLASIRESLEDLTGRLEVLVVDGLDRLQTASRSNFNRRSEGAFGLAMLARELRVPVIATLQSLEPLSLTAAPNLDWLARAFRGAEGHADNLWLVQDRSGMLQRLEPREGTAEHLQWMDEVDATWSEVRVHVTRRDAQSVGRATLSFDRATEALRDWEAPSSPL
jgi:hypothetical protein